MDVPTRTPYVMAVVTPAERMLIFLFNGRARVGGHLCWLGMDSSGFFAT